MPHSPSSVSIGLRTRVGGPFAVLLLVFSLLAMLPLLAAPAYADLGGGAGGTGDGDTCTAGSCGTPPVTGTGASGGTSGGGGSGGIAVPGTFSDRGIVWLPNAPYSPMGKAPHWGVLWSDDSKVYRWNSVNKCSGTAWTDENGVGFGYLGTEWWISGTYVTAFTDPSDPTLSIITYTATDGGFKCIDPPKYNIYDWQCFIGGNASYTGPRRNAESPVVAERTTGLGYKQSIFAQTGKDDPFRCLNPERLYWEVNNLKALGQYDLQTTARMQECEYYDYYTRSRKADVNDTDYLTCAGGRKYDAPAETDKLELFCEAPGRHRVFHNNSHTFSYADCRVPGGNPDPNTPDWSCGPVPAPVFNGRTSPNGGFTVLDDAKERKLKWDRPDPSGGIRNLKNKTVRLAFVNPTDRMSPYRAGEVANGPRQPFTVDADERDNHQRLSVDEWRSGWNQAMPAANDTQTGWDLAFMAPGVAAKPWKVAPTWAFDAEFLRYVPGEVKVDIQTGNWTVDMVEEWVDGNADCSGDPATLDVYRARNNQGN